MKWRNKIMGEKKLTDEEIVKALKNILEKVKNKITEGKENE